ncbi:hypothetical protein LguiA_002156 [Lonicera macranthoides]
MFLEKSSRTVVMQVQTLLGEDSLIGEGYLHWCSMLQFPNKNFSLFLKKKKKKKSKLCTWGGSFLLHA